MSFVGEQIKWLSDPLDRKHVKQREQSGRHLSYVEGWHCIAEANRIFGFDGWQRHTLETKCVSEREREIGQRKDPGWGVTYTAKVRIVVGDIVREGCGAGHGIDRDLGQAHESALKEAETDAMKRALMTFGNPFGLALYDKDQEGVAAPARSTSRLPPEPKPEPITPDAKADADDIIQQVRECGTEEDIRAVGKRTKKIYDALPKSEQVRIVKAGQDRKAFLSAKADHIMAG